MALTNINGLPLLRYGAAQRDSQPTCVALTSQVMDATNEAIIMFGRIRTSDGASHTLNTSGSFGFRTSPTMTWTSGTTVSLGIGTIDAANGPPTRASDTANVIDFLVKADLTFATAWTVNAWNTIAPTSGSTSINEGDYLAFSVQMTNRAGSDTMGIPVVAHVQNTGDLGVVGYQSATYTNLNYLPNVIIAFADGAYAYFADGFVASVGSTTMTWNSSSTTKEYGNVFSVPFPCKIFGIYAGVTLSAACDLVLYSDPFGTPTQQRIVSLDPEQTALATIIPYTTWFSSPYSVTANQVVAAIYKPGASNVSVHHLTLNSAAHQVAWGGGADVYAVSRNTVSSGTVFSVQNSNKDRFEIGLLLGAFDNGVGAGGALMMNPSLEGI